MADFNITAHSNAVRSYATWANENKSDAIAGQRQGGTVDKLTNVTSGFARLFNRGSVTTAKQTALAGFKAALTSAVGSTIADEVWRGIGGNSAKGLTPGMIRTGVALANRLVDSIKAQLLPPETATTTFLGMSGAEINGIVNPPTRGDAELIRAHGKLNVLFAKADSLNCMSPASTGDAKKIASQMRAVANEFGNAIHGIADDGSIEAANAQAQALRDKAAELDGQTQFLPDGQDPRIGLAEHWKESLAAACDKLMAMARTEPNMTQAKLAKLQQKFDRLQASYAGDKMLEAVKGKKKKLCGKIEGMLTKCVQAALGKHLSADFKGVYKHAFEQAHLSTLNKKPWDTIDKHFEGFIGANKISLNSKITCGRRIDEAIGRNYDEGVNAYNCHTSNTAHAINLATSELTVNGNTVFRGVRHGGHNAKVGTKAENATANVNRAKETVNAAFVEYLKMNPNPKVTNGVINFNMTSISLQTPANGPGGEHDKFFAQKAAWDAVNSLNEMTVTVDGKDYRVKPHVTTFSYGVNKLAVVLKGNLLTGWDNVSAMNKAGLDDMLGRAGQFANACTNQKVRNAVNTLIDQINDIRNNRLERSQGTEPYKMPARLAVLSYLMGEVPVWNCKSGKDRTGMLDVEAKFLSTLIDQGQPIPKPNEKLTDGQTQLLRTIVMQSGNLEMQQYNTGAAGYKLNGVSSIYSRLNADDAAEKSIKGGSGYVGH